MFGEARLRPDAGSSRGSAGRAGVKLDLGRVPTVAASRYREDVHSSGRSVRYSSNIGRGRCSIMAVWSGPTAQSAQS